MLNTFHSLPACGVVQEVPSVSTPQAVSNPLWDLPIVQQLTVQGAFDQWPAYVVVQEVPSVSSSAGSGQHSDPVWQVCWVDRGLEQEERLVTISTDGRVTQWATTKVRLGLIWDIEHGCYCFGVGCMYR